MSTNETYCAAGSGDGTFLRGLTWDHPRGYDPLVACSAVWRERTGVAIAWDRHSLQGFESAPVAELARRYDLLVIDHPHVGAIVAEGCVRPLPAPPAASVGPSAASYHWQGEQWALPIDAAAQVQAWRADGGGGALRGWDAAVAAVRDGDAVLPLRNPHALMCWFSLAAAQGEPGITADGSIATGTAARRAYDILAQIVAATGPAAFALDPIGALEMIAGGGRASAVPLLFGYVSYARSGFRAHRLAFGSMPAFRTKHAAGAILGGTGIAVSAFSRAPAAAQAFANWVAGAEAQRGPYAAAGGQVAHPAAWDDGDVDAAAGGFYHATRRALDSAWVRPRHDGYMRFQEAGATHLEKALLAGHEAGPTLTALADLYRATLPVH